MEQEIEKNWIYHVKDLKKPVLDWSNKNLQMLIFIYKKRS